MRDMICLQIFWRAFGAYHMAFISWAMAGMAFFERFAYRRKGGTMLINGTTDKGTECRGFTPNKAHQLDTVPETPDPLLPIPPKDDEEGHKSEKMRQLRRRRRPRISSSSEDEVKALSPIENTPRKTPGGIFSGLHFSKRLKKESQPSLSEQGHELGPKLMGGDQDVQGGSGLSSCRRLFGVKEDEGGNRTGSPGRTRMLTRTGIALG